MRGGKARIVVFLLILTILVPPLAGWWVWHELEHRTNLKISGRFSPAFFLPSFKLKDAAFEWDNKVKLFSGNLNVRYGFVPVFGNHLLRIRLSGTGLRAQLLGEWAQMQGVHGEVPIEHFEADLGFGPEGLREISSLDIESPAFQFHIKKSETLMSAQNSNREKKT